MSRTKRFEKEIDYNKFLMGGMMAIIASIIGWLINGILVADSLFLQIAVSIFIVGLFCGIIYLHFKNKKILDKLEVEHD